MREHCSIATFSVTCCRSNDRLSAHINTSQARHVRSPNMAYSEQKKACACLCHLPQLPQSLAMLIHVYCTPTTHCTGNEMAALALFRLLFLHPGSSACFEESGIRAEIASNMHAVAAGCVYQLQEQRNGSDPFGGACLLPHATRMNAVTTFEGL